jgi:hypothetical protein
MFDKKEKGARIFPAECFLIESESIKSIQEFARQQTFEENKKGAV